MEPVFEEAERWNLSQQGTASIINLINVASGKITKNDQSFVMTPDHVHKLQKKMRIEKVKERMGKSPIAIGVDERKDKTKVRTGDGQRGSKRYQVVKEDHATIIFWPEETYEATRTVHTKEIVRFQTFNNPELLHLITTLPKEVFETLNRDHQQLICLLEGLLTGEISQQWAEMAVGPVCSARYTTLQLYIN